MKDLVKKCTVYTLHSQYKDNDEEVLGAFDSIEAMLSFFAKCVAEDYPNNEKEPAYVTALVARLTANLLGKGDADECVDGRTRYWYGEYDVMGFNKEESV